MNKILIINIDQNYRSAYSALIASLLTKKYPNAKISIVTTSENDFLKTTNLFESIISIDLELFFQKTQDLDNQKIEIEMRKVLKLVIDVEWDQVINLSSNLLGPVFTCLLKSKKFLGPYAREELPDILYSSLSSLFLSTIPDEKNNYFHFAFLYKDIVGIYYDSPVKSFWDEKQVQEIDGLFQNLLKKEKKEKVVLIDASMNSNPDFKNVKFFNDLYTLIKNDTYLLPVFYSSNIDENNDILVELQKNEAGEVHFITCANKAQLTLVNKVSLIITDDLFMKTLSDLSHIPTILLGSDHALPLSDFSIVKKSHLVFHGSKCTILAHVIGAVINRIFKGSPIPKFEDVEIFSTEIFSSLPILTPVSVNDISGQEFAKWWLNVRFLAYKKKIDLPMVMLSKINYFEAIKKERQIIWDFGLDFKKKYDQGETFQGVLGIEVAESRFLNRKFSADPGEQTKELKTFQMKLIDFLVSEESALKSLD